MSLEAVARALQLNDAERTYLYDLAQAARPATRTPRRRRAAKVPPHVQWMLDSMTMSAAYVRNGRMDVVAINPLGRPLYSPMFDSDIADGRGVNLARFHFLDAAAHDFFCDWDGAANATVALLRAEAGRYPNDSGLRELVGELSTVSAEFRTRWAAHNVRVHHGGSKRLQHPEVGVLELTYQSLDLPTSDQAVLDLTIFTAEPGTASEDRLKLLAAGQRRSFGQHSRNPTSTATRGRPMANRRAASR
jgi:hypothetical protein